MSKSESAGKIIYLAFDGAYYKILQNFADMKKATVAEVVEEAARCFFAMLVNLPTCNLKDPDNFGFREFMQDSDCAASFGL